MLARFLRRATRLPTVAASASHPSAAVPRTLPYAPAHIRLFSDFGAAATPAGPSAWSAFSSPAVSAPPASGAAPRTSASSIPPAAAVPQAEGTADAGVAQTSETHIDNFDISEPIKAALRQNFKIENLFPIQAECYNPIVSGQDVIGRSKTGQCTDQTHACYRCILVPLSRPDPNTKAPLYQFLLLTMSSDKMAWWQERISLRVRIMTHFTVRI
jgi:hypothetical protein